MATLREIQTNLMRAMVVYTDKLTYFGKNAVTHALAQSWARPLAELFHLEKTSRKKLFLQTATGNDLSILGEERGVRRLEKTAASDIFIFQSASTQIASINEEAIPGKDDITVLNGTDFEVGDSIRIRAALGNPPTSETKTIESKPAANTLRVSALTNAYVENDFVIKRITLSAETTKARSAQGILFRLTQAVSVGDSNSLLLGENTDLGLADKGIAVSETLGTSGNIPAYSTFKMEPEVKGIVSVVNPVPAQGGTEKEDDSSYRVRIQREGGQIASDTEAWFTQAAQESDSTVLRTIIQKTIAINEVDLYLVARSGAPYSATQLQQIKAGIENRLQSNIRVNAKNVTFTAIQVTADVTIEPGKSLQDAFNSAASRLSAFIDWRTWPWGKDVDDSDLLRMVDGADAVDNTENFTPTSDVAVSDISLPRLASLSLRNSDDLTQILGGNLTQAF